MLESAPYIIIAIIFATLIGGVIGRFLSRVALNGEDKDSESTSHFHVDSATGIVSEATSIKYR
jgi:hypothetical protein